MDIDAHCLSLMDTAKHRWSLLNIDWYCLALVDTAWHWWTLLDLDGHCLTSVDTAWPWWTLFDIDGHRLISMYTAWYWWTSLDNEGHCFTLMNGIWRVWPWVCTNWNQRMPINTSVPYFIKLDRNTQLLISTGGNKHSSLWEVNEANSRRRVNVEGGGLESGEERRSCTKYCRNQGLEWRRREFSRRRIKRMHEPRTRSGGQ